MLLGYRQVTKRNSSKARFAKQRHNKTGGFVQAQNEQLLNHFVPARYRFIARGDLKSKIEALLRTLPTPLRSQCQPLSSYAEAVAESIAPLGPLLPAICQRLQAMIGVPLQEADFSVEKLKD